MALGASISHLGSSSLVIGSATVVAGAVRPSTARVPANTRLTEVDFDVFPLGAGLPTLFPSAGTIPRAHAECGVRGAFGATRRGDSLTSPVAHLVRCVERQACVQREAVA